MMCNMNSFFKYTEAVDGFYFIFCGIGRWGGAGELVEGEGGESMKIFHS